MSSGRSVVSTRWYWSDWLSDSTLRACSYAARGLWQDMLCIAGSNKHDYGFVSLNGRNLDERTIARMTNGTESEVHELIAELEKNGVLSRDRRGVIYCRRMVREEKNKRNGRLGAAATNLKNKEKQNSPPAPSTDTDTDTKKEGVAEATPARSRKRAPRESDWPSDYVERFWRLYPKRADSGATETKLEVLHRQGKVEWAVMISGLMRYAAAVTGWERRYVKSPLVWLNKGCWLDEYKTEEANGKDRQGKQGGRRGLSIHEIGERLANENRARDAAAGVRPGDGPDDSGSDLECLEAERG